MSYTRLLYHIVFSTKERVPRLKAGMVPRLAEYMGGIVRRHQGYLLACNGPKDHIHLAAALGPKFALMDVMKEIKKRSSKWIHHEFANSRDFGWQDDCAASSLSNSVLPKVVRYIETQEEHHATRSFTDELKPLLKRHGIGYDERHLV